QIISSIDQGPFELGTTRDTLGTTSEGGVLLGPERPRTYDSLNDPVSSKTKGRRAKGQCPTPACPATCDCVSSQYISPSGPLNASNHKSKHFDGVQKSLVTEVRAMKAVFKEMEAEVDQNAIDQNYGEIERKNLLITNENLIANCIAQDVFYTVTDSALSAS
ncbi:hypothetical protein Tco_0050515, partial [Tanacetum coccineum]